MRLQITLRRTSTATRSTISACRTRPEAASTGSGRSSSGYGSCSSRLVAESTKRGGLGWRVFFGGRTPLIAGSGGYLNSFPSRCQPGVPRLFLALGSRGRLSYFSLCYLCYIELGKRTFLGDLTVLLPNFFLTGIVIMS